jgi:phosphatidylserine/phosphatidylglycerophosphate/cardiolipin synthase-like enzyme
VTSRRSSGTSTATLRAFDRLPTWAKLALVLIVAAIAAGMWLRDNGYLSAPARVRAPASTNSFGLKPAARADWYELYFTTPTYPDNPANHRGGMDEALVALMNSATKTLDVASYDFDLPNVAGAMAAARRRGVAVRFVTDTDTINADENVDVQSALRKLSDAGIPIVGDRKEGLMHDKFTIVDGEWLSTGSWNYTVGDTYRLNNWMGIFHSPELAGRYSEEFAQMFSGKFEGAKSVARSNGPLTLGGMRVQTCFAPKGKCADLIVQTINAETKTSIRFLAFSFTHNGIGKAMLARKAAGATVSGVFETTGSQTPASEYDNLKKAGADVYSDGNPYVMHHKIILVDDHVTMAGSFNFSASADQDNDENLLVVRDPEFTSAFAAEFDRVLAQAKNPPRH